MDEMSNVDRFFSFMTDRHTIYMRKQAGAPFPWTLDPILQKYKFCNVFRELDTGTIWCREHIEEPFANNPELFFNIAAYRSINSWETWKEVYYMYAGYNGDGIKFINNYHPVLTEDVLKRRRRRGERIFTNAHMLTGVGGSDKIEMYCQKTWVQLWERRRELEPTKDDTLQSAFNKLLNAKIPAIGRFIAYEIITDLRHTRYLEHAQDIYTWANPGNGARRGIMRVFFGQLKDVKMTDHYCIEHMAFLLSVCGDYLPEHFPKLEMRDIEHTLCEFDKYERTRLGEGTARMRYVPHG
jgi:hypothetical protein